MIQNIITFGYRNKTLSIVLLIVFCFVSVGGLLKIQIDTSYESLISQEDEGWPDYKETVEEFGSDNTTIIYVKDKDLWSPERLRMLEDLVLKIEEFEVVEKVDSLFSITNIRDKEGILESGPLMDISPEDASRAVRVSGSSFHEESDWLALADAFVTVFKEMFAEKKASPIGGSAIIEV